MRSRRHDPRLAATSIGKRTDKVISRSHRIGKSGDDVRELPISIVALDPAHDFGKSIVTKDISNPRREILTLTMSIQLRRRPSFDGVEKWAECSGAFSRGMVSDPEGELVLLRHRNVDIPCSMPNAFQVRLKQHTGIGPFTDPVSMQVGNCFQAAPITKTLSG